MQLNLPAKDLAAILFPPAMYKRSLKGQWEFVCGNRLWQTCWWIWGVPDCIFNSSRHSLPSGSAQEQANNNLWWTCLPDLIIPVIPSRYTIFNVWDRKQQWEVQRSFPCAVLSSSSHQLWNRRTHTFTHRVGAGKRPGCCSLLLIHHCVSKNSFPYPSNGLVLRQCQQTCNFSFLFIRAQKAIQVLSMWYSLAPWGSAEHRKPRWKLSGSVENDPITGHSQFPEWLTHPSWSSLLARKCQSRSKTRSYKVKDIISQILMLGSCLPSLIAIFFLIHLIISPNTATSFPMQGCIWSCFYPLLLSQKIFLLLKRFFQILYNKCQ